MTVIGESIRNALDCINSNLEKLRDLLRDNPQYFTQDDLNEMAGLGVRLIAHGRTPLSQSNDEGDADDTDGLTPG